jgi:hypothetical protein
MRSRARMGDMAKIKKDIAFWYAYKGTILDKGAKEHIKRLERAYSRHRAKNTKKNV